MKRLLLRLVAVAVMGVLVLVMVVPAFAAPPLVTGGEGGCNDVGFCGGSGGTGTSTGDPCDPDSVSCDIDITASGGSGGHLLGTDLQGGSGGHLTDQLIVDPTGAEEDTQSIQGGGSAPGGDGNCTIHSETGSETTVDGPGPTDGAGTCN